MRIVLDTNILIAALITKDTPPDQLYQAHPRRSIFGSIPLRHEIEPRNDHPFRHREARSAEVIQR